MVFSGRELFVIRIDDNMLEGGLETSAINLCGTDIPQRLREKENFLTGLFNMIYLARYTNGSRGYSILVQKRENDLLVEARPRG